MNGLDSQLDPVCPTREVAQTRIFVYFMVALVTRKDEVKSFIKSSRLWFRIKKLYLKTNMTI